MKTIPLLYIGRRFENDRLIDLFLEEGKVKKEARFLARRRRVCFIGYWYKGTRKGKDDLTIPARGFMEQLEDQKPPSEEQIEKWKHEDDRAAILQERKRDAAKARRRLNKFKYYSFHSLAAACRNMAYWEAHEFIAYLVSDIQKGKKK
jgi:hypothetical protein